MNSAQYFEMWNAGYNEIKKDAPSATHPRAVARCHARDRTPASGRPGSSNIKADGTVPDEISNHLEGDGDDPVSVAHAINSDLSANGISAMPLSANEFHPQ